VSEDFGDADAARIWSLLNRRTQPEDVAYAEIKQLAGPVRIPENPALELWQRLCVPIRCQGLLLGFTWITDRYGDLTDDQIADAAHTAEAIGVLLHRRLVMTANDLQIRQYLVEQLLSEDPAARRAAREEALDRGLLDDGQAAVIVAGYRDGADEGLSPAVRPRSPSPWSASAGCWPAPLRWPRSGRAAPPWYSSASRIIRHSYHSTDYTALTRASYTHWRDLGNETGLELLRITGGLDLAPARFRRGGLAGRGR
jgi:hypothetical protein